MDNIVLLSLSIIINVLLITSLIKIKRKKHKIYGTIFTYDKESMYLELANEDSLRGIVKEDYVLFKVQHKNTQ